MCEWVDAHELVQEGKVELNALMRAWVRSGPGQHMQVCGHARYFGVRAFVCEGKVELDALMRAWVRCGPGQHMQVCAHPYLQILNEVLMGGWMDAHELVQEGKVELDALMRARVRSGPGQHMQVCTCVRVCV